MAYPAVASHNDDISSSESEGIRCFYMIEDRYSEDQRSFVCIAMNKSTGETTELTISPAPDTNEPQLVLLNYTAVSVGHTIYIIGGCCRFRFCPNDVTHPFHMHADVRVFNPLRPEDGWRDVAPMHVTRYKPAAVVIDGLIYVFGGSDLGLDPAEDGEWYDPNTDTWHLFPAKGYQPCFARIQASYGSKKILVNSIFVDEETLYMFCLDEQRWEIVSRDFDGCTISCVVVGDIIYAVVDKLDEKRPLLKGYHLIHKKWFPVELPPEIEFCGETARVIVSGSDRLCLMWHNLVKGKGAIRGGMKCVELRLDESYTTGSGSDGMMMIVKLSATKVSSNYFQVKYNESHKWMIAL